MRLEEPSDSQDPQTSEEDTPAEDWILTGRRQLVRV
jgi:hypothetical protein